MFRYFLDKLKQFLRLDKKNTIDTEKENNMSEYQGNKSNLNMQNVVILYICTKNCLVSIVFIM